MKLSSGSRSLRFLGVIMVLIMRASGADCLQTSLGIRAPSAPRATTSTGTDRRSPFHKKVPSAGSSSMLSQISTLRGGALNLSPEALALAQTLAPKVGVLTSTFLYFAPAATVLQAVKDEDIGSLNTLPLAIMSIVSVSWLAYGIASRDAYVALSNIAGAIGSAAYVLGILPLLAHRKKQLRTTQGVVLAGAASVLSLWTYLGVSHASLERVCMLLGLFASGLFIVLSGSPLSSIKSVIATRDSSSILGTLTAAQVVNTVLWTAYGLAIKDRFVWGPNSVGLGLGLVQLVLKLAFPAKKQQVTAAAADVSS
jgi:solute carrier family 50 protein (sugar transporter)